MAQTAAGQAVELINSIGFFDIAVRFILGFAISYGILEKTSVFGTNAQKINALLAACVGIIAVLAFN